MLESLCDELPTSVSSDLHSWHTVVCIFYAFLSYSTIMLNSVTIHAVKKTSALSISLKTLLLNLAVSDLGVGLLVLPLFIGVLIDKTPSCTLYSAFRLIIGLFSLASLFGIVALSVDRFLAVQLHLRYQELVTHKRVVTAVISIWPFSAMLSLMALLIPSNIMYLLFAAVHVVCLILTTLFYSRIYLVVRRHSDQIQSLQARQHTDVEAANIASVRKSAVGTFYVYLVLLVCYLPQIIDFVVVGTASDSSSTVKIYSLCSWSLIFLNSSLNPLVYSWKMRHIRHAIMHILRDILQRHH